MFIKRYVRPGSFMLSVLLLLFGLAPTAAAEIDELATSGCPTGNVDSIDFIKTEKGNANTELREIRDALASSSTTDINSLRDFVSGRGLLLPEKAQLDLGDGSRRVGYSITLGNDAYVATGLWEGKKMKEAELFRIDEAANGGFINNNIASTKSETIGNCRVGTTWQCKEQKGGGCIEKHCQRCTYLLYWKAIIACAVVACPYVANYTCCASGEGVPRMIGIQ